VSTDYRLDILTAAGVKLAEVTDFWTLSYRRQVNAPGLLTFTLLSDHRVVPQLEHNSQVIVYRRNPTIGLDWTADFWGFFRAQKRSYSDHDLFEARCPGILTMLSWRIVAWYAGTANRSSFQNAKAETIMKTLVSYNAGSSATTGNGRIRNGTISGISVQADGAGGNTISIDCAWDNLLEVLQKIATIGGGDFDLVKTGAQAWEFRWYAGQRGTDRTTTLLFALERGNMAEPVYTYDRVDERTVALVGGQGEENQRSVVVRTGVDYSASNDIEMFVDARNNSTTAGLNASGDTKLKETQAKQTFKFKVLQTPACYYGVHYQLGDLVKAQYGLVNVTQKIVGVSVSLDRDGMEKIDVEMETI
jgi:hypothetical protein